MTQGETQIATGAPTLPQGRMWLVVFGGPVAWTVHFLGSYAIVAVGCVYGWTATTWVVVVGTLLLTGGALWSTVVAWREWRRHSGDQAWDSALSEPRNWYGWLMMVGVLLGVTSAFTIMLEGLGTLMLPVCGWDVR